MVQKQHYVLYKKETSRTKLFMVKGSGASMSESTLTPTLSLEGEGWGEGSKCTNLITLSGAWRHHAPTDLTGWA